MEGLSEERLVKVLAYYRFTSRRTVHLDSAHQSMYNPYSESGGRLGRGKCGMPLNGLAFCLRPIYRPNRASFEATWISYF